jgi:regulator of sirC expression with transglutaminase-like and TPR domain
MIAPDTLEKTLESMGAFLRRVEDPAQDDWDPLELGLWIAKLEYPLLDVQVQKKTFLDNLKPVLKDFPKSASIKEKTTALLTLYRETLGFQGDTTNYYNVKNSFINDVFVRRKGIPITLSLVFMSLCREVGLKAAGISFPGHFLVKILDQENDKDFSEEWFVDAFDGARILSLEECKQRLENWTKGMIPFGPEALKVAHPRDIVSRTLRNLRAIYFEKEDLTRLYWVLTALVELCPNEKIESLRERAFLFARMGRYRAAIQDLRTVISSSPALHNRDHLEKILRYFELQKEVTN